MITDPNYKSAPDELQALAANEKNEHARAAFERAIAIVKKHDTQRLEDSKVALRDRKFEGKKTGGGVPYGRRVIDDKGTLADDLGEQRVIARARKLYVDGLSLARIADKLKEEGLEPRAITDENQGRFHATQISRMIDGKTRRQRAPKPTKKKTDTATSNGQRRR